MAEYIQDLVNKKMAEELEQMAWQPSKFLEPSVVGDPMNLKSTVGMPYHHKKKTKTQLLADSMRSSVSTSFETLAYIVKMRHRFPNFSQMLDGIAEYGPIAVVGGTPRAIALGLDVDTIKDLDLVVAAPMPEWFGMVAPYKTSTTYVGGIKCEFYDPYTADHLMVDVWALKDTGQLANEIGPVGFADYTTAMVLSSDAIAVELLTGAIHDKLFRRTFKEGVLFQVSSVNAFEPSVTVQKVLRAVKEYGLKLDLRMHRFVTQFIDAIEVVDDAVYCEKCNGQHTDHSGTPADLEEQAMQFINVALPTAPPWMGMETSAAQDSINLMQQQDQAAAFAGMPPIPHFGIAVNPDGSLDVKVVPKPY